MFEMLEWRAEARSAADRTKAWVALNSATVAIGKFALLVSFKKNAMARVRTQTQP